MQGSQEANFKELIRQRHRKKEIQVDVDFHTFQVGSPTRYEHVYSSDTRGHIYQAWPVKTTYKVTEHYQGEDLSREHDGKYFIFKDVHGEWLAVQQGEFKISKGTYVKT